MSDFVQPEENVDTGRLDVGVDHAHSLSVQAQQRGDVGRRVGLACAASK